MAQEIKQGRGKPKGLPKTGGRKPGTPNKTTSFNKQFIQSLLDEMTKKDLKTGVAQVKRDLLALEPYQRLCIIHKLYLLIAPKDQSSATDTESVRSIEDDIREILESER